MTTYRFDGPSTRRFHAGKCSICGKRVTRSQTFSQTVNPYNRNADGSRKSWLQVTAAVTAEAEAWVPDFTHDSCRASQCGEGDLPLLFSDPDEHDCGYDYEPDCDGCRAAYGDAGRASQRGES